MALKLMYITNRPDVAVIAENNGVDRIFVDMEYIGKAERQGGLDSVQNHHTIEDVRAVRAAVKKAELLVRVNPIHDEIHPFSGRNTETEIKYPYSVKEDCPSSEEEIEAVIEAGADIIMLPYFKTIEEIDRFLKIVDGRTKTMLLLETREAAALLDTILQMDGIDEIHIGLNDLSLSLHKTFMFELLSDGTVERLCRKMQLAGRFYGFGGVASLGRGLVPAEMIIKEHYRLGSRMAILSRSFCNISKFDELDAVEEIFYRGIREIRMLENECAFHLDYFMDNKRELGTAVSGAVEQMLHHR